MRRIRYRDDEESGSSGLFYAIAGAALGVVAGFVIADRYGGFARFAESVRNRLGALAEQLDEEGEPEQEALVPLAPEDEELEERVLEAFRNDPILSERAIDISALGEGVIELGGRVHAEDEIGHAETIAGGVPGVSVVENRLRVRASRVRAPSGTAGRTAAPRADAAERDVAAPRVSTEAAPERQAVLDARRAD